MQIKSQDPPKLNLMHRSNVRQRLKLTKLCLRLSLFTLCFEIENTLEMMYVFNGSPDVWYRTVVAT